MTTTSGNIQKFEVALGEEDGNQFAAIMWPEQLGEVPFRAPVKLSFVADGFALYGESIQEGLYFSGIDKSVILEMGSRHVVILKPSGSDYQQYEVSKTNEPFI